MDIMNSKKTLLSLINGGAVLGVPAGGNTVKFQFATSIATAAASQTAGALTFAADSNGNAAIYAQGTLVSSAIQKVVATAATGAKHGGKTVTVTYIGDAGSIQTSAFDVIDEAGLEAYFANSKTIALDSNNIYEVKTDGKTVLVDATLGLKTGLAIDYKAAVSGTPAHIALIDASNNELSTVAVSDIIGNGILDHTDYDSATNTLKLFFKQADGTLKEVDVDLSEMFDIDDWAVESGSEDFLHLTIDSSSTAEIGVKKADVTFTEATGQAAANLTVDTTNGKILDAADAIPAIKSYVDAVSSDNGISAEGDSYIDASVDADSNKKINIEAQIANLTVSKQGDADSTILGTSGKLVDNADAATKVGQFVNARIAEEVAKLDASIDSAAGTTFISAGVAEVDGKITSVVVHENIGSITGTAENLTGTAGLIDGADAATAVKTYVDGQINALGASVDSDDATYTKVGVKQVDGKITDVVVSQTKSTITASASALSATEGIADGQEFATGVKTYVDGRLDASIQALDASITADTTGHDISIYLEEVDGVVTTVGVEHTAATVTFTDAAGGRHANLEGSGSFVMASDIATIKNYVDAVAGALDSSVEDTDDSKGYVYVKTVQENGALDEQIVNVTYGEITATAGAIQIDANGIIDSSVLKEAIEGALVWTVLP